MNLPELIPAEFIKRDNRFRAGVRLADGGLATAHVPTTGRLTGVLKPGCRVWLEPAGESRRKTPYSLVLSELETGSLCSVKATLANRLFEEALQHRALEAFKNYDRVEHEVPIGHSRLDFRLANREHVCWVEVKSVTYAEDGMGKFPDAPTARGSKHLEELGQLAALGEQACVVFVAQRPDVLSFTPFTDIDPLFTDTLRHVCAGGVAAHAYRCEVSIYQINIAEEIPVIL